MTKLAPLSQFKPKQVQLRTFLPELPKVKKAEPCLDHVMGIGVSAKKTAPVIAAPKAGIPARKTHFNKIG
jgi:hypothetical protein